MASGGSGQGGRDPNRRAAASKQRAPAPAAEPPLAPGLYLVATPIGNLGDITLRALAALRGADRICCEDTRVTRRLLSRYGIATALEPYHDHNAERVRPLILAALRRGERVALVSDAGTPLVSDPGYKLVGAAIAEGLPVTALPGASAAMTGLILSGLPPDRFLFAGFLPVLSAPPPPGAAGWAGLDATLVFYEAPSRLAAMLGDLAEVLGDRPAAVARELTKLHEEVRRGRLAELAAHYRAAGPPRGEAVVIVAPPEAAAPEPADIDRRLRAALRSHGIREAAATLAAATGLPRRALYQRALELRGKQP